MNNQPQFVKAEGPNALKVIISGSYKKVGDGEVVDFEDVEVIMPLVSEERAIGAARKRYAHSAIRSVINPKTGERKYNKPIDHIRSVYIDGIEEIEHEFSYVGLGIKQMSEDDLQHLAVEKGIREIPLPRRQSGISMREMRERAYLLFADRVLGWNIDMNDPAQNNYAKWNDIIPNPMQKAAPVVQKNAEEMFEEKSKADEKLEPKHVAPQEEVAATAPHVANPDAPAPAPEAAPAVVANEGHPKTDELANLQDIAKENNVEYSWDTTIEELKRDLDASGVKF